MKARASFPPTIYENSNVTENSHESCGEPEHRDKVADIMARYYTRIDEIFRTEPSSDGRPRGGRPADDSLEGIEKSALADTTRPPAREHMDIINESRLKVNRISTIFSKIDDEVRKLETDGRLLSAVRENLDGLGRDFWDWLPHEEIREIDPALS